MLFISTIYSNHFLMTEILAQGLEVKGGVCVMSVLKETVSRTLETSLYPGALWRYEIKKWIICHEYNARRIVLKNANKYIVFQSHIKFH